MNNRHLLDGFPGILILAVIYALTSCNSGSKGKPGENRAGEQNYPVTRVGIVIKMDSTRMKEYLALHADSNRGVRDLLQKYNMRNFSIFMTKLEDGNYYEFGYYEYTGTDYEADMAALAREPRNIEWLGMCDPMQIPLKGETSWKRMKPIFYNN